MGVMGQDLTKHPFLTDLELKKFRKKLKSSQEAKI